MTLEQLTNECLEHQAAIETLINDTQLEQDLMEAIRINARTGFMLAEAKQLQDMAIKNNIRKDLETFINLPALTLNKFVNSYCYKENYLVNWLDRLNAASDKKAKAIITLISKLKAEMTMAKYGV